MKKLNKAQSFYDEATTITRDLMKEKMYLHISQNLQIPNALRIDDKEMKIWSQIIAGRTFRINQIIKWDNRGTFQLHVLKAPLLMVNSKGEKQILLSRSSWILNEAAIRSEIHIEGNYAHILIEYRQPLEEDERPTEDDSLLKSQVVVFTPTIEDFKQKRSFIRAPLSNKEIQDLIRFVDCECTRATRKERKSPLSIAIMNYEGKVLFDKLITPRDRMSDYGTKYHGITEKMARNKEDEYRVIKGIQSMMEGKILVGHDLTLELSSLLIPKYKLMGIRDLAGAKVFKSRKIPTKNNGQWYKLQALAKEVCGLNIQNGPHSAIEDVKAIRDIYLAVENEWEDDILPINQEVKCAKISLKDYQNRRQQPQVEISEEPHNKKMKRWSPIVDLDMEERWDSSPECQIVEENNEKTPAASTSKHQENEENKINLCKIPNILIDVGVNTENFSYVKDAECQTDSTLDDELAMFNTEDYMSFPEEIWQGETMELQWEKQTIKARIGNNSNVFHNRADSVDVATSTKGWDMELDEILAGEIVLQGETFVKSKITVEYRNAAGKIKMRTFDY